jgi:hypothetical protein
LVFSIVYICKMVVSETSLRDLNQSANSEIKPLTLVGDIHSKSNS